jgi:hypothetical protein
MERKGNPREDNDQKALHPVSEVHGLVSLHHEIHTINATQGQARITIPNRNGGNASMRRIRYQVACSLDGYIAGPKDEFDWITPEPSFDFDALYAQFDTLLMGRRTYETVQSMGETFRGKRVIVASRSLRQEDHPGC